MEPSTILTGLAAAPVIIGIVSILKGFIKDPRYWPVLSLVLGIGWNVAAVATLEPDANLGLAALIGVTVGLSASGAYGGGRAVAGGGSTGGG